MTDLYDFWLISLSYLNNCLLSGAVMQHRWGSKHDQARWENAYTKGLLYCTVRKKYSEATNRTATNRSMNSQNHHWKISSLLTTGKQDTSWTGRCMSLPALALSTEILLLAPENLRIFWSNTGTTPPGYNCPLSLVQERSKPALLTLVSVLRVVPSSEVTIETWDVGVPGSSSTVTVSSTISCGSCIIAMDVWLLGLCSWRDKNELCQCKEKHRRLEWPKEARL